MKISKYEKLLEYDGYSKLSINQMRILNYYLAVINPMSDKTAEQIIPIEDLLFAYNLKKGSIKNILLAVKEFQNKWIDESSGNTELKLFERFEATSIVGDRAIDIKPTKEFEYFIFDLGVDKKKKKDKRYISYKLVDITSLNSAKYLILYELLVGKRKNEVTLNVKDIISKVGLDNCKNCTDVRHNFLNSAVKQINKCTNIKIVSTSIERRGMLAENIVFDIEYSDCAEKTETCPEIETAKKIDRTDNSSANIDINEIEMGDDISEILNYSNNIDECQVINQKPDKKTIKLNDLKKILNEINPHCTELLKWFNIKEEKDDKDNLGRYYISMLHNTKEKEEACKFLENNLKYSYNCYYIDYEEINTRNGYEVLRPCLKKQTNDYESFKIYVDKIKTQEEIDKERVSYCPF